ncbi:MAG TPA: LytR C-terminal domain-containing protein [Pseudonocardiaceae bacterium]|nr:LytR C-terminal domain-containing protein [Pseudonocardiaceae bacterium]
MQGSRPVRLAGFVLIGIAVVAIGLGVFALTGNGSNQAAPPAGHPPVTTTPTHPAATTTTTHPPRTTTTRPAPTTTTTPTTTIAPPPTSQTVVQAVGVRVYNNSLIKNLAANAATDFRNAGYNVVFVGNYSQGVIPHSTAYFSPAPGEQQVATQLAQAFGMQVAPRFPGIAAASPGVIVILTEDFKGAK